MHALRVAILYLVSDADLLGWLVMCGVWVFPCLSSTLCRYRSEEVRSSQMSASFADTTDVRETDVNISFFALSLQTQIYLEVNQ